MNLRQYYATICIGTLLSWISWGLLLVNIDPFEASIFILVLFYATLYLSLVGTFSFLSTYLRHKKSGELLPMYHLVASGFRDAAILALFALSFLFLLSQGWLTLTTVITLLFLLLCIAALLSTRKKEESLS